MSFDGVLALIIEDDQRSVAVLQSLLHQLDIEVMTILNTDNIEADLADVALPDIVFLDLEMPRLNGYDVLEIIQSHSDFAGIPIVAYTTHISHLNDARQAGFHSFLGKPLDNREFPNQINRILNGESVWEAS